MLTLVPLLLAGCKTETITQTVILPCSATAPTGACDLGQSCFQGACVESLTLCSPTNLVGTCAGGTTCFGGGCVLVSALCSAQAPAGPCELGKTCFGGSCVPTASLCSTSNPTGACTTGQSCLNGVCGLPQQDPCTVQVYLQQPVIGVDTRAKLTIGGLEFKDSNGNGALDVYEDWRLNDLCRARDLVSRMTVQERIGLMSEGGTIGSGTADGALSTGTINNIKNNHLRYGLIRLGSRSARELAVYLNNLQKVCEAEPHGIPFIITTDPSHGFGLSTNANTGAQTIGASGVVSPWPYPLGLGAINDIAVTRQYGDMVRNEFKAMGFRWQLGPMADLATEPRWARVQNTFGENAFAVAQHVRACIEGFQGTGQGGLRNGIASTVKHFPGAGANEDGMDSHSRPGRFNVYPGGNFTYHQIPFKAAFDVGAAAVMPCYSIFKGQLEYSPEQTGSVYSEGLITRYMKEQLGFTGMVTADWGALGGSSWGVESLTPPQRAALFLKAGSHQFGSDNISIMQSAFDQGLVTEADLDRAAEKILEMGFKLGVFENPYVDPDTAAATVRSAENRLNGFIAQKKAIVILKNREHSTTANSGARYLPIDGVRRLADGGFIGDTNRNGVVEVFYDGVVDDLVGSDIYDDLLQPYDYRSESGTTADGGTFLAIDHAPTATVADLAVVVVSARKGTYFGLDDGVPLSYDAPFPGTQNDNSLSVAMRDRNKIIDLLRVRDGFTMWNGTVVPAANPNLKIILVMHMDRPGIVKPFVNGLTNLNELPGVEGSYPLVSDPANTRADGLGGVDAFLVEFGAHDRAVLDVLFNKNVPTTPAGYAYGQSRLPMEIPGTDQEVKDQFEDLPNDTKAPTYPLGAGSTY
ncbi:MAG: glycoside hydrolase family 3 N-terminal domain-containing protein [Archangium sp.]|nr:glycoside hydrolase family 3 N-terminal domain-containing protein [Archangium sp.]